VTRPRLLLLTLDGAGNAAPAAGKRGAGGPGWRDLPAAMPALSEVAEIRAHAPFRLPGASLAPEHMLEVAQQIEDALAADCDGAVVAQGPETIEESAFILDLLISGPKPVVVTGPTAEAAEAALDGPANLLAAAHAAASAAARGLGTLVVLGGAIHAARFVERHRAGGAASFLSPRLGPIGAVVDGRARFWAGVPRLPVLPSHAGPPRPVALLRWAMGDDGRRLGSLAMLGYAGAVVEGIGEGEVPMQAEPLLGELAARMPVVLASRSVAGAVFPSREDRGNAVGLLSRGLIAAGYLSGLKARLLLGFALRGGAGHAAAATAFAPYQ
jgi:L-asparaginase